MARVKLASQRSWNAPERTLADDRYGRVQAHVTVRHQSVIANGSFQSGRPEAKEAVVDPKGDIREVRNATAKQSSASDRMRATSPYVARNCC